MPGPVRWPTLAKFKQRVGALKSETFALYLAARHPLTPWYAKLLVAGIVAYAFSPIDLIPDFIPVLGYADDAVIVTVVLRSVVRRAGVDAVRVHWPGTEDGFTALRRLTGLKTPADAVNEDSARGR